MKLGVMGVWSRWAAVTIGLERAKRTESTGAKRLTETENSKQQNIRYLGLGLILVPGPEVPKPFFLLAFHRIFNPIVELFLLFGLASRIRQNSFL